MSGVRFFNIHRSWEDIFGMCLGVLIILSPWLTGQVNYGLGAQAVSGFMILNTILIGILVFGLAQLEYIALQRWQEVCEIAVGLWLIVSPFVLGYSGEGVLRFWHACLGGVVVLMAVLKLWQDWELTDQELAGHSQ
jgi:SPW repeat